MERERHYFSHWTFLIDFPENEGKTECGELKMIFIILGEIVNYVVMGSLGLSCGGKDWPSISVKRFMKNEWCC